ncbi:MFS transporter [Chryseobacterium ginsengisoli]|uniref:MFS transporter n=1 Tax=Chryseobacterium ginsengisoli TaxID=363853 RepID=A0ABP9M5R3_9FLAO
MKTINLQRMALLVLLTAHLLTIVDIFIVNIAIPSIEDGLASSNAETQLIVAIYMIGLASFLIIGSRAGDYYGRKYLFMIGLLLFMIFSAGCGFASSSKQLIALRFFQGISAGLMSPQVLSYIQILFPSDKERTYALGWYGITIGIGTMLGQFLGGFLVEIKPFIINQSWRYIFLINIPICLLNLFLAKLFLKNSVNASVLSMDYKGASILCLSLILLLFSITIGYEQSVTVCIFTFVASLLLIMYFLFSQRQNENKVLLDLKLFRFKNFNMAVLAVILFMFMLDAYFFVLALFLQEGLNLSPMQAGYFVIFQGSGFIITSLFAAPIILKFGKNILIIGILLIMSALIFQLILFKYPIIDWKSYMTMVFHGCGVALVLPAFANIAMKGLPENMVGNASGVYSTLQQLAGALGIALNGGLFYYIIDQNLGWINFYQAFAYSSCIHFVCLILVLFILILLPKSILKKV